LSNAAPPCRGSVDFAKPTYPQPMLRQGNRDGVIGATISNAPPPFVTIRKNTVKC
jgi:hypothetical protein